MNASSVTIGHDHAFSTCFRMAEACRRPVRLGSICGPAQSDSMSVCVPPAASSRARRYVTAMLTVVRPTTAVTRASCRRRSRGPCFGATTPCRKPDIASCLRDAVGSRPESGGQKTRGGSQYPGFAQRIALAGGTSLTKRWALSTRSLAATGSAVTIPWWASRARRPTRVPNDSVTRDVASSCTPRRAELTRPAVLAFCSIIVGRRNWRW